MNEFAITLNSEGLGQPSHDFTVRFTPPIDLDIN